MEGISPISNTSETEATFRIPFIASSEDLPPADQLDYSVAVVAWAENTSLLSTNCKSIAQLAAFKQSYLFAGLLSRFLDCQNTRELIANGDYVNINQPQMHKAIRKWRLQYSKMSQLQRENKIASLRVLLDQSMRLSDIFDTRAASLADSDRDYAVIALSVRLLIDLLTLILDDAFASIDSRLRGYLEELFPALFKFGSDVYEPSIITISRTDAFKRLSQDSRGLTPINGHTGREGPATRLLLEIFVARGWCPARARQICQSFGYTIANYMASVHVSARSRPEVHIPCINAPKCKAFIVDSLSPESYHIQHDGHEDCEFTMNFYDNVCRIVKSGAVPLVSVAASGDDLDIKIIQCTARTSYVAISHVWSDGLGNPSANSLPLCQVRRLRTIVSECDKYPYSQICGGNTYWARFRRAFAYGQNESRRPGRRNTTNDNRRINFWLDTFCIPASRNRLMGTEDEDVKILAIKHITPVFAGAYRVLILDNALQQVRLRSQTLEPEDIATMVLGSTWMQRGWTFEEGALGANCVFEMADAYFDVYTSFRQRTDKTSAMLSPLSRAFNIIRQRVAVALERSLLYERKELNIDSKMLRVRKLSQMLRIPEFVRIWNSLIERTATRPHDVAYIMANLLGFNIYPLKNVPNHDRIRVLIQHCEELPLSLLYNSGPRWHQTEHLSLTWLPTAVGGDYLTLGGKMRRLVADDKGISYSLEPNKSNMSSFVLLEISQLASSDTIPPKQFLVHLSPRGLLPVEMVVISLDQALSLNDMPSEHQFSQIRNHQGEANFVKFLLLLDFTPGSQSAYSVLGKGALFQFLGQHSSKMHLSFLRSFNFYNQHQWRCRGGDGIALHQLTFLETLGLDHSELNLVLRLFTDTREWPNILTRRPLSLQYPTYAQLTSILVFLLIFPTFVFLLILGAYFTIGDRFFDSKLFTRLVLWIGLGLAVWPASLVLKWLADLNYQKWLKSFEEPEKSVHPRRRSCLNTAISRRSLRKLWPRRRRYSNDLGEGQIVLR